MASGPSSDDLLRMAALGQGKNNNEEPAGKDNALMELLMQGFTTFVTALGRSSNSNITAAATSALTTGADAGVKLDGFAGKPILAGSFSGGDTFLRKLAALFLKDRGNIVPMEHVDVSWARLGELSAPITPNTGGEGISRSSGIQYDA